MRLKAITGMRPRKLYKFACVCLLLWLVFGLFAVVPQANASPDWVTETSSAITVQNDYYKAVIDKTTGSFGGIKDFYIKPYTTVDLVESTSTFDIMGGHEWGDYNKSVFYDQFSGEVFDTEISILKQTTDYAIVYSEFDVGVAGNSMTVKEWKTFYYDKPYYQVSFSRKFNQAVINIHDDQVCFLFENNWVQQLIFLNETGQIETINKPSGTTILGSYFNPLASMEIASSYSWGAYYNSTYDKYFGTIITDINPYWSAFLMEWTIAGSSNTYSEYQITLGTNKLYYGAEEWFCSYINYVADAYTDISNFAKSLWSGTYSDDSVTNFWCWTENGIPANYFQGSLIWDYYVGVTSSTPFALVFRAGWASLTELAIKIAPSYRNATNIYYVWDFNNHVVLKSYNSTTSANITYSTTYENKWLINMTFQVYNDTEIIKVKGYWKALTNVSTKWLKWYVGNEAVRKKLNSTMVIQDNATVSNHYYRGWLAMNKTAYKEVHSPDDFFTVYRNESVGTILSGTEYNMEYWFQPCRKYLTEGKFATTDFLQLHQSKLKTYRNYWVHLLGDSETIIKDYSQEDFHLLYSNYEDARLTLYLDGEGTKQFTLKLPTDRGQPQSVSGATWSYNASTMMLTLNLFHSDAAGEIVVDWRISGDVNGDGIVDIYDLARIGKAYGAAPGSPSWDEEADINYDGIIDIYDLSPVGKNYGKTLP